MQRELHMRTKIAGSSCVPKSASAKEIQKMQLPRRAAQLQLRMIHPGVDRALTDEVSQSVDFLLACIPSLEAILH